MRFYPMIAEKGFRLLRPGGALVVEIGHGQGDDVLEILKAAGFTGVEMKKDYNGLERMVAGRRGD